ncbi:leucine-rich repeat protein [Marvinbryantia formatexigens]|nr:leucine-rich repeat protein [Marvinbryantia formatexigens]UWO24086.1 leucine-rich repeat domain-containing protein [Marvinbryantia formatexigens DSM 14469]SDG64013.1 Leucine rich repeat-containing protein [Marvinbryantia formatexigens]
MKNKSAMTIALVFTALSSISVTASDASMFEFESNGDGTCILTKYVGEDDVDVTIPSSSEAGELISGIGERAFAYAEINSVSMSSLEMTIDERAFASSEIEELSITDCTLEIDDNVFSSCDELEKISISNSELNIQKDCFYYAGDDASLSIIDSTISSDDKLFFGGSLSSLEISGSTLNLEKETFSCVDNLKTISIADSVFNSDEKTFYYSGDKADVSLANSQITLDEKAFFGSDIRTLTVEGCSFDVGEEAFSCSELEEIMLSGCGSVDMGDKTFYSNARLSSVTILGNNETQSVIELGEKCFFGCGKLESVMIGNASSIVLNDELFDCCDELTSVTFGSGNIQFGEDVFSRYNDKLKIDVGENSYDCETIQSLSNSTIVSTTDAVADTINTAGKEVSELETNNSFGDEQGDADTQRSETTDSTPDGISPKFKEAMDSYEEFFDQYVDLTVKMENNPDDLGIIADYAAFMADYVDTMQKFEDYEDSDMTDAEALYYAEVSLRISQKLLSVSTDE